MSGLNFKNSVAAMGNLSMQPIQPAAKIAAAINVIQLSSTGPKITNIPLKDIIQVQKSTTMIPLISLNLKSPVIIPILPVSKRHIQFLAQPDLRLANKLAQPSPAATPFEQLTGVSNVRPEIVLATNFRPMFDEGANKSQRSGETISDSYVTGMTEFGEFIDTQIQLNQLKHEAISRLVKDLKNDQTFKAQLNQKEGDFTFHLTNLLMHSGYLRDIITQLEQLKLVFNLRHETFSVDFKQLINTMFSSAQTSLISTLDSKSSVQTDFNFSSVLAELGFNRNNISSFSNTKIFLQTLYELNNSCKGYTNNLLGINPLEQSNDSDPAFINHHTIKNFNFQISNILTVPFSSLMSLQQKDVLTTVNNIKTSFDTMFSNVHLPNDESKISFLFQYMSKEFNFSSALNNPQFKTFMNNEYGYPISDQFSNEQMFDVITGYIGDKITDRVNVLSDNSLSNTAQIAVGNVAILPFETDYILYENATFTPGSVYLIDNLINFQNAAKPGYNTGNLDAFTKSSRAQIGRISQLCRYLNLIPDLRFNQEVQSFSTIVGHSTKFFDSVLYGFIDNSTNAPKKNMVSDVIAIFNKAQNDSYLKSLLFTYVFSRTFGVGNSKSVQVLDTLIPEIGRQIGHTVSQDTRKISVIIPVKNRSASATKASVIPAEGLEHSLRSTNDFLSMFFSQFKAIFNVFKTGNVGINGEVTRYSHTQDTVLLMIIFEALLGVVNKYVKTSFVGQFLTKSKASTGKTFLSTKTSLVNNSISIQLVRKKLQFEHDIMIKLLFVLLSSLQTIVDSSSNVVSTLSDDAHTNHLLEILDIVGDQKLLTMIMNEQQINLIESTVGDIVSKAVAPASLTGIAGTDEEDVQLELGNQKDDTTILDDSLISQSVRHTMFSYFAGDKFTSKSARNIRLLTVGVPSGFSANLRQLIKIDKLSPKSYEPKQTDVIKINVYKVDVEHQDIIFKPQSFIFELNRYVSRNSQNYKKMPVQGTLNDILSSVPTQDFSYVDGKLQNRAGCLGDPNFSLTTSPEYDFLTQQQKFDLLHNHVASYMFELYIRNLTGMQISEYDFPVDKTSISNVNGSPFVSSGMLDLRMRKAFPGANVKNVIQVEDLGVFAPGVPPPPPPPMPTPNSTQIVTSQNETIHFDTIGASSGKTAQIIHNTATMIHYFRTTRTQYVDNTNESRRIFMPKIFERIFNIAVDPNDFEVDTTETLRSASGKEAFNKLLKQGRIVSPASSLSAYQSSVHPREVYKLVTRDKDEGDLVFEKYFVNFETVLNTEV